METKTPVLPKGKKVTLGDGRKGVVVRKEERVGFHGYIVKITDSKDESQIGTTVGATVPGLKWGQMQTTPVQTNPTMATEVPAVTELGDDPKELLEKLKKVTEQRVRDEQQALSNKQREISMMQAVGQIAPPIPQQQQELEQNLEQQEQSEEQEMDEQQNIGMQNQMMQQTQQQMQQMNTGQQQMLMKQSFTQLARPERADIEIRLDKVAVLCDVAATPKQQVTGLQAYDNLPRNRGLWFPQYSRRATCFHMGDVRFPIDIVFVDNDRVAKIVSGVQPRQMGSWSATCTDVIEVNGGWCEDNGVGIGSKVATPLTGKKQARSELEKSLNQTWSGPQKARLKSETAQKSYDLLRTITEASSDKDPILQQIEELIPELKKVADRPLKHWQMLERLAECWKMLRDPSTSPWEDDYKLEDEACKLEDTLIKMGVNPYKEIGEDKAPWPQKRAQENYKVKPDTHREQPGEVDLRDPLERYRHVEPVPNEDGINYNPINPKDPGVTQFDKSHYEIQVGSDPLVEPKRPIEERDPTEGEMVTRPASKQAQVRVNTPNTELAGVDTGKLAKSSLKLYAEHPPEWGETNDPRGYNKMAVINDQIISNWVGSLGFDDKSEAKLRKVVFTDEYKRLLGDSLVSARLVSEFDVFGGDLLLYKRE